MRVTIPEQSLVLLIDQAGSGKTEFAARYFRPSEVLSLDAVRLMIADGDASAAATEAAWDALLEIAVRRMSQGRLTVIDANVTDAARREPFLQAAAETHYITCAFLFGEAGDPSLEWEGFRRVYHIATAAEAAAVELDRQLLWSRREDEAGPLDIVGSVHGRFVELTDLLTRLGYVLEPALHHPAGRKLVFLGDLIDHGPRNLDVLHLVMGAVDAGVAYAVPGNHDARLVSRLRGVRTDTDGGMTVTLSELATASAELRERIRSFLEGAVSHYVFDHGDLVVAHAGLKDEMHGRGTTAVREFALRADSPGECESALLETTPDWVRDYAGDAFVVYSHPTVSAPLRLNRTINLDTGAALPGGCLSALRYPEMEIVSSAPVPLGPGSAEVALK